MGETHRNKALLSLNPSASASIACFVPRFLSVNIALYLLKSGRSVFINWFFNVSMSFVVLGGAGSIEVKDEEEISIEGSEDCSHSIRSMAI